MCELFGINAGVEVTPNEWLKTFFRHSDKNPHGWGMAMFYGKDAVALEKEPQRADSSAYLKSRLMQKIPVHTMLAHIRRATIGTAEYCNCHPFVNRDRNGRCWTLIHNGTIFESAVLSPYVFRQEGETDSERILYYIIDQVNLRSEVLKREPDADERFELIQEITGTLAPENKLNFLLYDGEILYAHTNQADTLYCCEVDGAVLIATVPFHISFEIKWRKMPFLTLCTFQNGKLLRLGSPHNYEYHEDPEKMKYLYMAFAKL